ncbi:MAG: hypothetical protein C0597_08255 [Marinilabiliales bacterium]|nr:MAG: hypothetical protein C0597_08255 [Marinilabiliales bacterium]
MEINILQWIGYAASVIIALSMTMNSIVKFRWINLIGAITFSIYGFFIGALPVGFLNGFIVCVDIYYLFKIYSKKETFETLEVRADNKYLLRFLEFHHKEIQRFFPGFSYRPEMNTISFFVLRNTAVAGLFLAHRENDNVLKVGLDYVIPEYRDFKNGRFIYMRLRKYFIENGFDLVMASGNSEKYTKYLKKLGFSKDSEGMFVKVLDKTKL